MDFYPGVLDYQKQNLQQVMQMAGLTSTSLRGKRIMEIGGNGNMAIAKTFYHWSGIKVTEVTPDPALHPDAIDDEKFDLLIRPAEDSGLPDNSFDLIYGGAVLEHILEYECLFRECFRLLKPGGHLLLNGGPLWNSRIGHHLFVVNNRMDYRFNGNNPIPDFGHLYLTREELDVVLAKRHIPLMDRKAIIRQIYDDKMLNRASLKDITRSFQSLPWDAVQIQKDEAQPDRKILSRIRSRQGTIEDRTFAVNLYIAARKPSQGAAIAVEHAVSAMKEVAIDWTQTFDYQKLTKEELEEYSNIEVTKDLREGGIHAHKAWVYWFQYLAEHVWKTSLHGEIVSFSNTIDDPRILSLGCGYGGVELEIAQSLNKPYEIMAVDINEHIFAKARAEAKTKGINIQFLRLDLNFVEIQENTFDLIFAHASLHHLLNLEHVFYQIYKGLKKNGRLIVQDVIGKTQILFWKDNVDFAIEVVKKMPVRYKSGVPNQHAIITPYAEPSIQKGMEGIRQEDIPAQIDKYFAPVKMFRYGSFMRMICTHPEVGKRLDPDKKEDREYLEQLFRLDLQQVEKNKLRPTEMLALYEKRASIDIKKINSEAHVSLGSYLLLQGDTDKAVKHFKSAAALDPDNQAAQRNLAVASDGRRQSNTTFRLFPNLRKMCIKIQKGLLKG